MPSLLIRHHVEVQPVAELLVLDGAQEPVPVDTQRPGPRHDALPLGQDVVTFADVGEAGQWRWSRLDWMHNVHGLVTVRADRS